MTVDPDILRAFAGQVDTASTLIAEGDAGAKVATAADGLPGSTTQWAARLVGIHAGEQAAALAANIGRIGAAVRGSAGDYEVTDADLAKNFEGIF
ncbi:type VII secretion target [Mycolicibacterium parafortuitum]|uniref:type VII secretion target n=1 Tax=Mycolicibacterium parafortuitum TaxID=39692 RepID=UPI0015F0A60D|nr:type VII secretion target [Mycolicibacterium parafortuitum]